MHTWWVPSQPCRAQWEASLPTVLVNQTADHLEALCSHISFPRTLRSFSFLLSPLPKSSKEKRRLAQFKAVFLSFLISNLNDGRDENHCLERPHLWIL